MRDGDEAMFAEYVAARLTSLCRFGYLVCGNWHTSEDAVSRVLVKLSQMWHRIRDEEHLDAYVRRMLLHALIDERRRPWRRESLSKLPAEWAVDEPATTHDATTVVDDRLALRSALAQLPPRRRAVLVLRYFEELSVEETAAAMNCSAGTVKSQTARALATLRDLLPEDCLPGFGGSE